MNIDVIRTRVTAAEFVRHFGCWQEEAVQRPVYVTHHGRDRLVMLSITSYQALRAHGTAPVPGVEPRIGSMLDQLVEGYFAVDGEYRIVAINPVAAGYFRLIRSTAAGMRLPDQVAGIEGSLLMGHLARAVSAGEIANFSAPSPAYAGRCLHMRVFPYGDGAACLMRDITDEVEAQRRCEMDAASMAALRAHGGIGLARLSPRGTFVEIDAILAGMAGFAPQMLLRARLIDILPLDRRVAAASELEKVLATGEARAFDTALLVNRGGEASVRIALARAAGERGAEGALVMVTRI